MLSKDPDQRYQSMSSLIADLERCHSGESGTPDGDSTRDLVATLRSSSEAVQDTGFKSSEESSTGALNAPPVGIDFGTVTAAIAGIDEAGQPTPLTDLDGESEAFSTVTIDGDLSVSPTDSASGAQPKSDLRSGPSIIVGKRALQETPLPGKRVVSAIKRSLGRIGLHQFGDGDAYPPELFAAMILRRLVNHAGSQIGDIQEAVLAVPACFDDPQRKSLQDAVAIAGLERVTLVSEPLAAAVAFADQRGLLRGDSTAGETQKVMIFDLGGGVFDVSVVEISASRVRVLATDGDPALGGCDWDRCLMDWIAERCQAGHGLDPRLDDSAAFSLLSKCEIAKRSLSARDEVELAVEFQQKVLRAKIDRKRLEDLTGDLLERTASQTLNVLKCSGQDWQQIDHVLLIGGGSQMPMVHDMIRELSGKKPQLPRSSDQLVMKGAALLSAAKLKRLSRPLETQDVNSRQLGVVGRDKRSGSKRHAVMIPRNAPLPAMARQTFKIQKEGQGSLRVHIVQGNSNLPEKCTSIGKLSVVGLPLDLPVGTPVDVEFRLTTNGRLELSVPTDRIPSAKPLFTRDCGMSADQVNSWHEWLETMTLCGQIE
jgi:molecular chaperone DnaK